MKTPLIITVAFLVFLNYDLDIVAVLLRGFPEIQAQNIGSPTVPGQTLAALLIAGGSGGGFQIFTRLGLRSPEERDRNARNERASMQEGTGEPSPMQTRSMLPLPVRTHATSRVVPALSSLSTHSSFGKNRPLEPPVTGHHGLWWVPSPNLMPERTSRPPH